MNKRSSSRPATCRANGLMAQGTAQCTKSRVVAGGAHSVRGRVLSTYSLTDVHPKAAASVRQTRGLVVVHAARNRYSRGLRRAKTFPATLRHATAGGLVELHRAFIHTPRAGFLVHYILGAIAADTSITAITPRTVSATRLLRGVAHTVTASLAPSCICAFGHVSLRVAGHARKHGRHVLTGRQYNT